jgi:hypothetical protein
MVLLVMSHKLNSSLCNFPNDASASFNSRGAISIKSRAFKIVVKVFDEGKQRGLVQSGEMFPGGSPAAGLLGGFLVFIFHRRDFLAQRRKDAK